MDALPLPSLLSHALVAFTIELDNEFERQMPHRTTRFGSTGGPGSPWLVSMAMWFNCMRFVGEEGVTARELERLARTPTNLLGMRRWRYIVLGEDGMIRPTRAGRAAQQVWRPLPEAIEKRWRDRFGDSQIQELRESLSALAGQFDYNLPDCLPILGYGLFSRVSPLEPAPQSEPDPPLPALLARVLLAFAIEFETKPDVSLAICANVLRPVADEGALVRDLPRLAGVSKEAIAVALGYLEKRGYAMIRTESSGKRVKTLALTPKGRLARAAYLERVWTIEKGWSARFGQEILDRLRDSLERLTPNLFQGLAPHPGGWRALIPKPEVLPHYPMVSHRGGFPDGS